MTAPNNDETVTPAADPHVVEITAQDAHDLRRRVLRDGTPSTAVEFDVDGRPGTFHLGALWAGGLVGVSTWAWQDRPDQPRVPAIRLRGMAVEPQQQGRGVGRLLVAAGLDRSRRAGALSVWALARDTALGFYARMGFATEGDGFVDATTGLPHHVIVMPMAPAAVQAATLVDRTLSEAIDLAISDFMASAHVPGVAFGIVAGGHLVQHGSAGVRRVGEGEEVAPTHQTCFRIASMTKSFTAAAVLRLRDEGLVGLEDPIERYVPQTASWPKPTLDSPAITVRHLLTMASGLTTDDPWADRHLDADRAEMDAILASAGVFASAPGHEFHYSNLGYATLGRLIENVTGHPPQRYISTQFLAPLGMERSGWTADEVAVDGDVATGYVWRDGRFVAEPPPLGDGAFAPMGGLWSTVEDIARWITFMCDAWPARSDDAARPAPPLSRASRRQMQIVNQAEAPTVSLGDDGRLGPMVTGYGMGLFVVHDPVLGRVVAHSGGLPGFGSQMRWLPDRGVGVVVLANARYAPGRVLAAQLLRVIGDRGGLPAHVEPAQPALDDLAHRLGALLADWSHERALALFSDNVGLDEDLDRRQAAAARVMERIGRARVESVTVLNGGEFDMTLVGERGRAKVEASLAPLLPARIQWYSIDVET
jgi:CubicO group peptidase (beta-lactamase class C family)/GNAT superfamily N-acetyltransferase